MPFRENEERANGTQKAIQYYITTSDFSANEKEENKKELIKLINTHGPVVSQYPAWHPLLKSEKINNPYSGLYPNEERGYKGLDHTIYFSNGFITCPYSDGEEVIESIYSLPNNINNPYANIHAKKLNIKLYNSGVTPILVYCEWKVPLTNNIIPSNLAIALMLKLTLSGYSPEQYEESWENIRSYFLGSPHGSRSSLFVTQETGIMMKKIWNLILKSGMYKSREIQTVVDFKIGYNGIVGFYQNYKE